jgi:cation diffusion facilitator CzcD-associated flavoprotein CzcO
VLSSANVVFGICLSCRVGIDLPWSVVVEAMACLGDEPPAPASKFGRVSQHGNHVMPDIHALVERPSEAQLAVSDAIIIGAGISGMYMLYRLRELGMTVRVFEAGTNVGGTWYWNRYPGARFDSESWTYGYSFSKELMQEWDWKEHFSPQPDTLEYLNYVADKFDLRRDIEFRSTVTAAHWDESANQWNVTLESGQRATSRFLFTAIGILSAYTLPAIPGRDSFKGPA